MPNSGRKHPEFREIPGGTIPSFSLDFVLLVNQSQSSPMSHLDLRVNDGPMHPLKGNECITAYELGLGLRVKGG